jgi:DNA-binding HxlR family transcriptional regulator
VSRGKQTADDARLAARTNPAMPTDPAGPRDPAELAALAEALRAVGDRWSALVLASMIDGPLRFGELQERLAEIAPNVLSQRLRRLDELGLVVAEAYSTRPPRYGYGLTASGRDLAEALRLLTDWGVRHLAHDGPATPIHEACGMPLQVGWYCATCEEPVPAGGEDEPDYQL